MLGHQFVGALVGAVVERDGEAVAGRVAGEVRTHDSEPEHADIRQFRHRLSSSDDRRTKRPVLDHPGLQWQPGGSCVDTPRVRP
jgi:hypothetical protein